MNEGHGQNKIDSGKTWRGKTGELLTIVVKIGGFRLRGERWRERPIGRGGSVSDSLVHLARRARSENEREEERRREKGEREGRRKKGERVGVEVEETRREGNPNDSVSSNSRALRRPKTPTSGVRPKLGRAREFLGSFLNVARM